MLADVVLLLLDPARRGHLHRRLRRCAPVVLVGLLLNLQLHLQLLLLLLLLLLEDLLIFFFMLDRLLLELIDRQASVLVFYLVRLCVMPLANSGGRRVVGARIFTLLDDVDLGLRVIVINAVSWMLPTIVTLRAVSVLCAFLGLARVVPRQD